MLENNQFSCMLPDGSLLQMLYKEKEGNIIEHRLCYAPCPVDIPEGALIAEGEFSEIVKNCLRSGDLEKNVRLRTTLRFDFNPNQSATNHAASHITINKDSCRIPCTAPLDPYHFVEFVLRAFHPNESSQVEEWCQMASKKRNTSKTILQGEESGPHLNWRLNLENF